MVITSGTGGILMSQRFPANQKIVLEMDQEVVPLHVGADVPSRQGLVILTFQDVLTALSFHNTIVQKLAGRGGNFEVLRFGIFGNPVPERGNPVPERGNSPWYD